MIESSYESAHKKALKEHKILIVFLTKESCPQCNTVLKKIIRDKEVASLIEREALFCIVTKGQKSSYPIEMLYTSEYPTLFFLDANELFNCNTLVGKVELSKIKECLVLKPKR